MNLPKHAAGLSISHNEHLTYYQTVAEHIDGPGSPQFRTPEEKAACVRSNEIWEMRWYPRTPVGSHHIAANSLPALLSYAEEFQAALDAEPNPAP